jgi:predicted acetyltransferase
VDNETRERPSVLLRPMDVWDEQQARQAHEELANDDFEFLFVKPGEAWPVYLERVESGRLGVDLPDGWVPSTFLVAEVEGQVVGRVSIRHELNAFLQQFAGHIGYGVRPGFRRRGYATDILRRSLEVAASIGLARVLVTCDVDNLGSATVIERCGGVLENVVPGPEGSVSKCRYWVETTTSTMRS